MRTTPATILFLLSLSCTLRDALRALPQARGGVVARPADSTSSTAGPTMLGWTTHSDAKGFAMETPPGWNFTSDARTGRILVQGPRDEQAIVWPASIQQTLDAQGASALVQQLARQV
ncbi:MAG: hypothetical protein ABSA96_12165, partial [Candidatus Acidiferrales bacterium]